MNSDNDLFDMYAAIALHAIIGKLTNEVLESAPDAAIAKSADMACEFADAMLRAKERQS